MIAAARSSVANEPARLTEARARLLRVAEYGTHEGIHLRRIVEPLVEAAYLERKTQMCVGILTRFVYTTDAGRAALASFVERGRRL